VREDPLEGGFYFQRLPEFEKGMVFGEMWEGYCGSSKGAWWEMAMR
jgi:hypothetical protein